MFDSNDARALADLGFIAVSRGLDDHAAAIFDGLQVIRPEQEAGFIGRALVDLHRGDFGVAVKTLRALPPTDAARLFLGMALARDGETSEARTILEDVARTAAIAPMAELARGLLDSLGQKPTTPFAF